jgi:uncharacterized membrane protein (UPF0127 family)
VRFSARRSATCGGGSRPFAWLAIRGRRKVNERLRTLWLTLLVIAAGALGSACQAQSAPIESLTHFPRTTLEIASRGHRNRFEIWIADTPTRQEQGLMFVRDLPASEGMLFPQSPPQVAHFWMKNTYIPLDMIFVGEDGRIAKIIANAHPFSLDVLSSDVPVTAVLEIGGGEAQRLGIHVGNRVTWKK